MAQRTTVIGVATYPGREAALIDFAAVLASRDEGALGHVGVAVLERGADGKLHVDRHDTTARNLPWGDALVGGALAVVAAPLAVAPLSVAVAQGSTWAGVGAIVGHFWHNTPRSQLRRMSDLLDSGSVALVVVGVDHTAPEIEVLLPNATERIVTEADCGDLEQAYEDAHSLPAPRTRS